MKIIRFIVDNSTAITGLVTAALGLLIAFGLHISKDQIGAIMAFLGALVLVLASMVTTSKRRVVSLVDSAGVIRAGQASTSPTGRPSEVKRNENGRLVPQSAVKPELLKPEAA